MLAVEVSRSGEDLNKAGITVKYYSDENNKEYTHRTPTDFISLNEWNLIIVSVSPTRLSVQSGLYGSQLHNQ